MFFYSHGGLLFVGQGWCVGILPPSLPAANPPPSKREALLAPSLRESIPSRRRGGATMLTVNVWWFCGRTMCPYAKEQNVNEKAKQKGRMISAPTLYSFCTGRVP